jgi:rubrerythrin
MTREARKSWGEGEGQKDGTKKKYDLGIFSAGQGSRKSLADGLAAQRPPERAGIPQEIRNRYEMMKAEEEDEEEIEAICEVCGDDCLVHPASGPALCPNCMAVQG